MDQGPKYQIRNSEVGTGKSRKHSEVIGIGNDLLNRTPAAQQLRERMDKWDFIKLKRLCTTKEIIFKLKRLPTEWEKIFSSYISD
jgi:hypothetical protein